MLRSAPNGVLDEVDPFLRDQPCDAGDQWPVRRHIQPQAQLQVALAELLAVHVRRAVRGGQQGVVGGVPHHRVDAVEESL